PSPIAGSGCQGTLEETRQDSGSDRPAQRAIPQGCPLRKPDGERPTRVVTGAMERRQIQRCVASRRRLSAAEQPRRLDAPRVLGNLHATRRGGTRFPRAEVRITAAPDLAPLQWPNASPCLRMRFGLCVMENTRPSRQASRLADADSKTRPDPWQRRAQT